MPRKRCRNPYPKTLDPKTQKPKGLSQSPQPKIRTPTPQNPKALNPRQWMSESLSTIYSLRKADISLPTRAGVSRFRQFSRCVKHMAQLINAKVMGTRCSTTWRRPLTHVEFWASRGVWGGKVDFRVLEVNLTGLGLKLSGQP